MLRLFVALPLPEKARRDLASLQRKLDCPGFARNPHLTLRFIGNADCAEPIAAALGTIKCKAFDLRLTHLGHFRKNILCLAPEPCPLLIELKLGIDAVLASCGLPPEKREFRPHLTLARNISPASVALLGERGKPEIDIRWQVEDFCLFNSLLRPQGALHEELARYRLKK